LEDRAPAGVFAKLRQQTSTRFAFKNLTTMYELGRAIVAKLQRKPINSFSTACRSKPFDWHIWSRLLRMKELIHSKC
jgi:hypothetical protein